MTLVILGTQDKQFKRLLDKIEEEIKKGNLEDVIVQSGNTKYKSKNMKVFDFIPMNKFNNFLKEADLIITHGGVGSIIQSLEQNKKIIAVPRLKEFKEHVNDHQIEIVEEFDKLGYIIGCNDLNDLEQCLKKAKTFKPKKYISDNSKMLNLIENYINKL